MRLVSEQKDTTEFLLSCSLILSSLLLEAFSLKTDLGDVSYFPLVAAIAVPIGLDYRMVIFFKDFEERSLERLRTVYFPSPAPFQNRLCEITRNAILLFSLLSFITSLLLFNIF